MNRETIIDRLRAELRRQAEAPGNHLAIAKGRDPDTYHVMGFLDLHKLAEAIRGDR